MSDAARGAVLQEDCRELRLPTALREYPALARQGTQGGWRYEEFLSHLLEAEILSPPPGNSGPAGAGGPLPRRKDSGPDPVG